ncbi:hypothetical protein I9G50_005015 [Salmonella enterica]|nr:hypothetical protein [Salmonella enterica]EBT7965523.1 hypothetical protein [Salmonella enterica]ECP4147042.1 hypothetical protein [Salmonella enterica]EDY4584338.1 hypothetical protein [Salmonella enterica]EGS6736670.1 hypothetical protein [Salmonella enterica]
MTESKRPILSISGKRKPSLMYQKPAGKSEQDPEQGDVQPVTASTRAKPKYKGLPEWHVVLRTRADLLYSQIPLTDKPKKKTDYYGNSGKR